MQFHKCALKEVFHKCALKEVFHKCALKEVFHKCALKEVFHKCALKEVFHKCALKEVHVSVKGGRCDQGDEIGHKLLATRDHRRCCNALQYTAVNYTLGVKKCPSS